MVRLGSFINICSFLTLAFTLGKDVDLPPASEEVAGFYAAMIETDHAQDATFNKNFFEDWKKVLKANPPVRYHIHFWLLPSSDVI